MMAKANKCTAIEIEFSLHVAGIKVLLEKDDHLRNNTTTTRVWTVEILTKRLPPSLPLYGTGNISNAAIIRWIWGTQEIFISQMHC